jgi:hypothetical protein
MRYRDHLVKGLQRSLRETSMTVEALKPAGDRLPTNIRAFGVGLPYAITVSVFGGTAPAIALYFKSLGHEDWFYYYLSGIILLSLIIYATMRDTRHVSAMHLHE